MDDLVQWLRAQLDKGERIARAACWVQPEDDPTAAHWSAVPSQGAPWPWLVVDRLGDGVACMLSENADPESVARHVDEHDPARVLREIDAMRKLIDLHKPIPDPAPPFRDADGFLCSVCTSGGTMYDQQRGVLFTDLTVFPCRTLRLLALPYAARLPGVLAPLAADQQSPQPSQKLRALLCPAGLPGGVALPCPRSQRERQAASPAYAGPPTVSPEQATAPLPCRSVQGRGDRGHSSQ